MGRLLKAESSNQSGQHGETLTLLKIQLAEHGGTCLWSQLLGRLRHEDCLNLGSGGCSELRSCHCTPAWETEQDFISKNKTKQTKTKTEKHKEIENIHLLHEHFSSSGCQISPFLRHTSQGLQPSLALSFPLSPLSAALQSS